MNVPKSPPMVRLSSHYPHSAVRSLIDSFRLGQRESLNLPPGPRLPEHQCSRA